jgi:hypothetical protein
MRFFGSMLIVLASSAPRSNAGSPPVDFAKDVRPILQTRCFVCHGPTKQKGGLRLDRAAAIDRGGESGAAIVPNKSSESHLVKRLLGQDSDRMPPTGEPLTKAQIETIRRWIDEGARKPVEIERESSLRVDWAFQPLKKPTVPAGRDDHRWVRTPIDAFVLDKLRANGLHPSPEADRRILMRRVHLDLLGVTPLPEEIEAFVADDSSDAFERLVDRLLSSPRYGERWARHWLDVAHYADSHGQDQDRPRPNAWPYRDYLIRALNADKPYSRFVQEQVAGDALHPDDSEALAATGFLAAGPWDESGLRDIQDDTIDREAARYLDRDDIVTSTMSTFAGVTVGCARCHDHKFDPIPQEDYYALQAVFAGIDKAERSYDADPAVARARMSLAEELNRVRSLQKLSSPELATKERLAEVAAFERERASAAESWTVVTPLTWKSKHGSSLKALLDRSILAVGSRPDRDVYTVTLPLDKPATALRLELLCDDTLPHLGPGRQDNGNLHLSEVRVSIQRKGKSSQSTPVKLKSAVADFDQEGWGVANAIDGDPTTAWGIHPEVGKPHVAVFEFERPTTASADSELVVQLDQLHGGGHLIGRFRLSLTSSAVTEAHRPIAKSIEAILAVPELKRTPTQRMALARYVWQRRLERELANLPPPSKVYCGTNRFAPDGSFKPSPNPRPVHLLTRGEITKPGKLTPPGTLHAVSGLPSRFALKDASAEHERRIALADWLTSENNPLVWRTIVNRVWHYHFGLGLCDTPNDLGAMGGTPSHPELLDWLASEFRDSGGSLKRLHRLIVTSSVYRQAVRHDPAADEKDQDNRWLWRMNRGRLDAESLRDSILLIGGRLDERKFGPPTMHFMIKPGVHVTPDADYDRYDVDAAEARRRSVYRFILRTRPDPLLAALDCPEASLSAPVRGSSLGATQALVLWNNKFTLRHAEHLAGLASGNANQLKEQVAFVVRRVLLRMPTESEAGAWTAYAAKHGLANFCRVLLNSTEFLFID